MNSEKQRLAEERAYALWEAEGRLHGKHEEHWHRAAREIEAEETASPAVKRFPLRRRRAEHGEFGQPLAAAKEKVVRIRGLRRLGAGRSGLLFVALRQVLWA
jgi:hypothetical protein